eukprot:COSAG02_NODE_396_length_23126_cov_282.150258_5_plen_60_part_00
MVADVQESASVVMVALVLFNTRQVHGQPQASPEITQLHNQPRHHIPRLVDDGHSGLKIS